MKLKTSWQKPICSVMPELPDLVYIEKKLNEFLPGQTIAVAEVREPIVMRMLLSGRFVEELSERYLHSPEKNPFRIC